MTVFRHRLFWPAAILVALLVSNVFFSPSFFSITLQDGHLYGSLIRSPCAETSLARVVILFLLSAPAPARQRRRRWPPP